jgi:hypothetical protein
MIAGCTKNEIGQTLRTIIKIDEGGSMFSKGIEEEQNQNFVMKEDEITLSHKSNQGEDYR